MGTIPGLVHRRTGSMKPAIIIVDMVKDNVDPSSPSTIGVEGSKIIPNLQHLLAIARGKKLPVVFANDSFLPHDFLWQSIMKPHAIRGTAGAEVIDELKPQDTDIILPKRRFSAFYKTDLDITLRELGVDTIVVCGIITEVCVTMTALDGIGNDFRAIILSDCCASRSPEIREQTLGLHRKSPLRPLLKIMTLAEFIASLDLGRVVPKGA